MKKLLLILSAITLSGACYADHKLDFNDSSDVVTCNNGSYTISKNSTQEEISSNCKVVRATAHQGSAKLPRLEFIGDNGAKVSCSFKKSKVDKCKIKD